MLLHIPRRSGAAVALVATACLLTGPLPARAEPAATNGSPAGPAASSTDAPASRSVGGEGDGADTAPSDAPDATTPDASPPGTSTGVTDTGPGPTAPTPAPHAATSSALELQIASTEDGHGPFTTEDAPGGDTSARNGRVRTADAVTWSVSVTSRSGDVGDAVLDLRSVDGATFGDMPDRCEKGSTVSANQLSCALGDLDNGTTIIPVVTSVPQTAADGSPVRIRGAVRGSGSTASEATSDTLLVSAAPRWDLAAKTSVPAFHPAEGPDGSTPGYRIVYPVLVHGNSLDPSQGTLGLEALQGDLSFVDDVSRMHGDEPSQAVLFSQDGAPACGINTGQLANTPGGRGGGANAVADSGTFTCEQAGPGQPVTVTIHGIDSSLATVPSKSVTGAGLTGGVKPYIVSGYITLWVPSPPTNESFTARNVYRDLVAPSLSGQANYPDGNEPTGNNVVDRNIGEFAGVVGSTHYRGTDQGTTKERRASGKDDQPYVTPGQDLLTRANLGNYGTTTWRGTQVCTVFDRSVQTLRRVDGKWAFSSRPRTTGAPMYAAFGSSDPAALRDATCGDDETWYDDPTKVPGGPAAVGKVRWTYDHPGDSTLTFVALLQAHADLADYTRLRHYTSVRRTATTGWRHDVNPADEANGNWADFLTATADLARVTTKMVDPGYTAEDTPDRGHYVKAGDTATFAIYPTVTNATGGGQPGDLVVTDLVPAGSWYVDGSASLAPESVDEITDEHGVTRQRLTWRIPAVRANDDVPPLTFDLQMGAVTGPVLSEAAVIWDRDISEAPRKKASRGLHVLAGSGFSLRETADARVHVVGDEIVFTLQQQNNGSTRLPSSRLVAVLPYDGDGRGTKTGGRVVLRGPVTVSPGETVRYTSAAPTSVPRDPDATGPTWCTEAEFGAAGCPRTLADATAVRLDRTPEMAPGTTVTHTLPVTVQNGRPDARLALDFTFRALGFPAAVTSRTAASDIVSGSVGGRIWLDGDRDGIQGSDEPGLSDVDVVLTGTNDLGDQIDVSTVSDADGHYAFDGLRPGRYRFDAGPAEHGWTTPHRGDDPRRDSDVDSDGLADVRLVRLTTPGGALIGVTRTGEIDAGALPGPEPTPDPTPTPTPDPTPTPTPTPTPDPMPGPAPTPSTDTPTDDATAHPVVPSAQDDDPRGGPAAHPRALAFTGTNVALAGLVLALMAIGTGAIGVRRRRQED
ncbi:SdrD B-like domain-containing protein [Frigoribacterium sp. PhB24]|uniref:SdrD B-like domain-containing protein n=1 Tax=Frigoribacterium sp. PhB24 TaxID=2485204 RepID=UPI000F49BF6A|nr:SdrD B-like domain-containing protein [Frigoribacterium sp. PhB24]ROS51510.1 SdrD B-like protein [Frigoribacterium sp. PhB24]